MSRGRAFSPRVIGVVHLPPLPGTAKGGPAASLLAILDTARKDAVSYANGGVDAIIVENFGDAPFRRGSVEPYVIAAMTRATIVVAQESGLPVGVNLLRNDVVGAVSIAAMSGARFVRANVYVGAAVTDQGIIQGEAELVQALIRGLGAEVDVWADIDVKHAAQLAPRPVAEQATDAIERGLAAAVIVTGPATGMAADEAELALVRSVIGNSLVFAGSGVSVENIRGTLGIADGVIVGTAMKVDGIVTNVVDAERVRALVEAAKTI
ncbi:MAG: BtpA/SgcQ family protein [Thermomicrobiales bacterium]